MLLGRYMPSPLGYYPGVEFLVHRYSHFSGFSQRGFLWGSTDLSSLLGIYEESGGIMFEADTSLLKGLGFLSIMKLWETSLSFRLLGSPASSCSVRIQHESFEGEGWPHFGYFKCPFRSPSDCQNPC